jgi:phosphohistidine swiveling domain-containing protein
MQDIIDHSEAYRALVSDAGDTPYAVRALPRVDGLPVLRNRKLLVGDLAKWLLSQDANLKNYDFSFEAHIDPVAAALFVVGPERVFGEAAHGGILQLNKGSLSEDGSLRFEFDYRQWRFSRLDARLESFLRAALGFLHIADEGRQSGIAKAIGSTFTSSYLSGYFEVINSPRDGPVFIDYNRELLRNAEQLLMDDAVLSKDLPARTLRGQPASHGVVSGRARVLKDDSPGALSLRPGEILVCHFTSPALLPLIIQAAAVVTDVGGVLSHAAIVCRELQKPCVVGLKTATLVINDLDEIEVDGEHGIIRVFGGQDD